MQKVKGHTVHTTWIYNTCGRCLNGESPKLNFISAFWGRVRPHHSRAHPCMDRQTDRQTHLQHHSSKERLLMERTGNLKRLS